MKHTECEDCKLREGDCGHHFKMDGKTNYDIASLSACDQYGNCTFFKAKAEPKAELAEKLKDRIEESVCKYCQMNKHCELCEISRVFSIIALTDKEMKEGDKK